MKTPLHRWGLAMAFCCIGGALAAQPNYDLKQMQHERLARGLVAVRKDARQVALSWRYLSADPMQTSFNLYRDGQPIAQVPPTAGTFWLDSFDGDGAATYTVCPVVNGQEQPGTSYTLPAQAPTGFIDIPLDVPAPGTTPAGDTYEYSPNDASVADLDGDGNYEIILKWDPSNSHDNAHDGYTGNVLIDAYRLTGERLWRIDLGRNIRAGAHYTQFMAYDLDGDGRAEVVMKTADGTVDGTGTVIGQADADHREPGDPSQPRGGDFPPGDPRGKGKPGDPPRNQGRILTGPEYLTVFAGTTGKALCTVPYNPPRGRLADWGDPRANRSDRFLACVAHLDGRRPSVVMCRGYYTRAVLTAYDWDGQQLRQRWVFDSNQPGHEAYAGQGNHNLRVADVDGDGCDEIVYGSCTIDHDGRGLYSTGLGHGDALHLTQFIPDSRRLQVWACHENRKDGSTLRDAATGRILFQVPSTKDVGRCMAADIDPTNPGVEMWSHDTGGIRDVQGRLVAANPVDGLTCNMVVWWDGDLLRELLDRNVISKYDWNEKRCHTLLTLDGCQWNNGTKANPALQGDIAGDWREEVLMRTDDNRSLRLYISTEPTPYRFHTFLEDPVYRLSLATQNVAYNQPTQPGFYFGPDLKGVFRGCDLDQAKSAEAGDATANDSNSPLHLLKPAYRNGYGLLTVSQVKASMDRVLHYLQGCTPTRVVHKHTGTELTDYARLDTCAQLERGTFRLGSYEWGVTYSAMLSAWEATGDEAYRDYVRQRFGFLARVAPHFRQVLQSQGVTDPQMVQILQPKALDDAGAMCAAMIKAKLQDPDLPVDSLIANYYDFIAHREHRLADGTFARNRPYRNSLWLDDMFMGIPAVAWMSRYDPDRRKACQKEAVRQVTQFAERMFVPEKGLFRHGWIEGMEPHPAFHWGRANGWAILTLCEVLDALPQNAAGRDKLIGLLRAHARALAACQGQNGFWHQLLDRNDTYEETSATALYVYALAHAINQGWIDATAYGPAVILGWHAVASAINAKGQVEGVCVGTGMGFDPAFYAYRPVNVHAAHGYGPAIWAGAEVIRMLKQQHVHSNDSAVLLYREAQPTAQPIFEEQ